MTEMVEPPRMTALAGMIRNPKPTSDLDLRIHEDLQVSGFTLEEIQKDLAAIPIEGYLSWILWLMGRWIEIDAWVTIVLPDGSQQQCQYKDGQWTKMAPSIKFADEMCW